MEKMNVIWKASKPQYIGCGDDVEVRRFQGVATFETETFHEVCAKVEQWMSDASVDYGEECGTFHVFGGFLGDVSDFMSGKSDFYGEKELWDLISHTIENHKNAELENKAMEEMWEIQCSPEIVKKCESMGMKPQPECVGICDFCEDEDKREGTPLYRYGKNLMCGGCCAEAEGDKRFVEMAYGRD